MSDMDTISVTLLVIAAAWAIAAAANWRSGSVRQAGWYALAAAGHASVSWWQPGAPLLVAALLAGGLALPTGSLATAPRRSLAGVGLVAGFGWMLALANGVSAGRAEVFVPVALTVFCVAGGSVALRWRSATRSDKRTLHWLLASLVLTAAFSAVVVALHFLIDAPHTVGPWLVAALALVPLGQAFAAWPRVRHAAESVLVESIVVAGMAAFVVAVYLVVVIGLGEVPVGRERDVLVSSLMAAVVVAVLALPVRQRCLGIGATVTGARSVIAEQSLSTFGARMTRAIPMDELLLQVAESLHATIAGSGAEIWVGADGVLSRGVSVPQRQPARLELGGQERVVVARARIGGPRWVSVWLPELADDSDTSGVATEGAGAGNILRVAPISHLGDLLGLLVVRRGADDPSFTEDDERLLVELARQLGLALHNVRLDSALQASLEELQHRNVELQASRLRIVTASDESRQAIERNLHDGAQQYLVALAVKLNLAGQVAEEEPQTLAPLLEELRADVQATIRELRELAHGIYPPLLRDRGLREALRTAANRSPLACELTVELPGRYPQPVETAVYFCCLEALQNASKHAGASAQVRMRVGADPAEVWFSVEDDGAGFETTGAAGNGFLNMRDRLGAIGGRLVVTSTPGQGSAIRGWIPATPVAELVSVPADSAAVRA